ncbi:MAG: hypothetical protein SVY15_01960 [Halobacteriota archaeon]|nr:hypothetical protein [Halobacteriota archaeon]
MGKYEIRTDVTKNRMYLKLAGFFHEEEIAGDIDIILEEVKKLKPGYDAVSEINEFKPASPKAAAAMMKAQKALKESGLNRIIRVSGSNVLGRKQFERSGKEAGYSADTASSVEEADRMLDN